VALELSGLGIPFIFGNPPSLLKFRPHSKLVPGGCEHEFVTIVSAAQQAMILHADMDAFYASVEQRDNPALAGRPVLVGGGVIMAASYEAKARGVSTPVNRREAMAICPDAVVIEPRGEAYAAASRKVMEILARFSPTVEKISVDEAFLDGAGMEHIHGSPREIAEKIRAAVREEAGLAITIGVARTKFLAKIASGAAKPDGLLVVEPGGESAFLHPLPIEVVWGIGKVTAEKLHRRGIRKVGELAAYDVEALEQLLGASTGRRLHALANNRDPRSITPRERRKSFGAQRALKSQRRSEAELVAILGELIDRVLPRLRRAGRSARTLTLIVRFADQSRVTRSQTLPKASNGSDEFFAAAKQQLAALYGQIERQGITLLGVTLAGLEDGAQLELSFDAANRSELDEAVDAVNERFGKDAIRRGALIGKERGFAAPQVDD
jgi:DNA polymerase-4